MLNTLHDLTLALRSFAAERDWDRFHSPKNLVMALSVEVAELMEHFQWLTQEQSGCLPPEKQLAVRAELADVLIYLVRLADRLGIDLLAAAEEKMARNATRYPTALCRGRADRPVLPEEEA